MRQQRERAAPREGTALVGVVPPPTPPADGEYVRQINDFFRRLHGPLVSHAERFVGRDDALDVVSEVFLERWRRWAELPAAARTDQVFFAAVRRTAVKLRRAMRPVVPLDEVEEELEVRALAVAEVGPPWRGTTADDVIDAALAAMPERRREVFLLAKEHGFSYSEIAEALGLTLATVNAHIVRAGMAIRAALVKARIALPTIQTPRLPSPKGGADHD